MSRSSPELRTVAAAATGLAVAWAVAVAVDAVLAAPELGERALLAERRVVALGPPLVLLCWAALVRRGGRNARLTVVFAAFAGAWAIWGMVVRCAHGGAEVLGALQAAWHERVLLPAVALAAIGAAWAADERANGKTSGSRPGGETSPDGPRLSPGETPC